MYKHMKFRVDAGIAIDRGELKIVLGRCPQRVTVKEKRNLYGYYRTTEVHLE
ncbi:hypothetical protein Fmac_008626 [Flemingia macrophylla]|uniref:Uncharacterized protein n=1 Tax=Flemingia macrophylla TaxID=520843 RepID=A0ABD1MXY4_9FABA